jgi:hypothetical protein
VADSAMLIKGFPKELHQELRIWGIRTETSLKELVIRYCQEGLERDQKQKKK